LESKKVFLHIYADPDPESKNLANPTDPDSKHWKNNDYITIRK